MKIGKHEIHPWHFLKVCTLTALFVPLIVVASVAESLAHLLKWLSD